MQLWTKLVVVVVVTTVVHMLVGESNKSNRNSFDRGSL